MSKISIIVPVYNVEAYLNRCVASILNQSFKDFELILVDDGSPDNCPQLCDDFAKKDSRIKVIHKENGGLSDARNKGLDYIFENSNSEWVTFIDSDDWVHKDYLKLMYTACIENNTNVSVCDYIYTYEYNIIDNDIKTKNYEIWDTENFYCKKNKNCIASCMKFYRKDLFSNIRFPFGKYCEDVYIVHEILFSQSKISFIPNILYYYYQNDNSIMHLINIKKFNDEIKGREQQILFFKNNSYKKAYFQSYISYFNQIINIFYIIYKNEKLNFVNELVFNSIIIENFNSVFMLFDNNNFIGKNNFISKLLNFRIKLKNFIFVFLIKRKLFKYVFKIMR